MNLTIEYQVTVCYDTRAVRNPRGEWVVIAHCKECGCDRHVAWFQSEVEARMWALQKNNPAAFAEFCKKMGGVDGVDPLEWLRSNDPSRSVVSI